LYDSSVSGWYSQEYKTIVKYKRMNRKNVVQAFAIQCYYSICLERLQKTHVKRLTINCIGITREVRALLHKRKALPHFMT
jgi:hypothetical protein